VPKVHGQMFQSMEEYAWDQQTLFSLILTAVSSFSIHGLYQGQG
jgi:hypothetical protein